MAKEERSEPSTFSKVWSNTLLNICNPISKILVVTSGGAARHPKTCVVSTILFSLAMVAVGIFTNFYVENNADLLWTPTPSRVLSHGKWVKEESNFPSQRLFRLSIHADGRNVLAKEGLARVFTAVDVVTKTFNYDKICDKSLLTMPTSNGNNRTTTCAIISPTKFWNYTVALFKEQVMDDTDAREALSQTEYPDQSKVDTNLIIGSSERDNSTNLLTSAKIYVISIFLPVLEETSDFELKAIDNLKQLQQKWQTEIGNTYRVDFIADRSFDDEFGRAIVKDIPLVPMIFCVMTIFTCLIFSKPSRNCVTSRSLLGFGAVVGVLLSIMSRYGLLFIIGVPFTSMTQILPFIMFGIGLDDTFILSGAFQRLDKKNDVLLRIDETMKEVGLSIFLTSLTSIVAFSLGCISSVPAVRWLCQYAIPTLLFNFLFQITFVVALMVMDEKRIEDQRKDCLICFRVVVDSKSSASDPSQEEEDELVSLEKNKESAIDRFMVWLGNFLMKPLVKALVIILFLGFSVGMAYSASLLDVSFKFVDVLPNPSYVRDFFDVYLVLNRGSEKGVRPYIHFRDVDQSDEFIQEQMETYVEEMTQTEQLLEPPPLFWLRDYKIFVGNSTFTDAGSISFSERLDIFLAEPRYKVYNNDIVRNTDNGDIVSSRVQFRMSGVDNNDANSQIKALLDQRTVSLAQPINQKGSDGSKSNDRWAFFTFHDQYYIWQFYANASYELILTAITGIIAVSTIGTIFIPHWSAFFFIAPVISMLYVDLLGFLQLCGIGINPVSYVALVMSVGLMVDFILHILLRYYESKEKSSEDKVKDCLRTMGKSVLIGGVSTFLGVLPLSLSTTEIFKTIFIAFIGLVTIGIFHGLVFLPVVLSMFAPNVVLNSSTSRSDDDKNKEEMREKAKGSDTKS